MWCGWQLTLPAVTKGHLVRVGERVRVRVRVRVGVRVRVRLPSP